MDVTNGFEPAAILAARALQWFFQAPPKVIAKWVSAVYLDTEQDIVHDKSKHHCFIGDIDPGIGDLVVKTVHSNFTPSWIPHKHCIKASETNVLRENIRLKFINEIEYLGGNSQMVFGFTPYTGVVIPKIMIFHAPVYFQIIAGDDDEDTSKFGMIGQAHIAVQY